MRSLFPKWYWSQNRFPFRNRNTHFRPDDVTRSDRKLHVRYFSASPWQRWIQIIVEFKSDAFAVKRTHRQKWNSVPGLRGCGTRPLGQLAPKRFGMNLLHTRPCQNVPLPKHHPPGFCAILTRTYGDELSESPQGNQWLQVSAGTEEIFHTSCYWKRVFTPNILRTEFFQGVESCREGESVGGVIVGLSDVSMLSVIVSTEWVSFYWEFFFL